MLTYGMAVKRIFLLYQLLVNRITFEMTTNDHLRINSSSSMRQRRSISSTARGYRCAMMALCGSGRKMTIVLLFVPLCWMLSKTPELSESSTELLVSRCPHTRYEPPSSHPHRPCSSRPRLFRNSYVRSSEAPSQSPATSGMRTPFTYRTRVNS